MQPASVVSTEKVSVFQQKGQFQSPVRALESGRKKFMRGD
jgi:hypothetical protein